MTIRSSSDAKKSGRLVRDIADSLGKEPPQALEMEESVLGALMLGARVELPQVVDFLRADHFYSEQHIEIYQAIYDLYRAGNPVDMKTVVVQLRTNGKLDIIGGAYYIAELTSKVSSAANIAYHARVVVEMAMKRRMIQLASNIHQSAYDDSTDGPELLERTIESFKTVFDTEIAVPRAQKIQNTWKETMVTDEPPYVEPYIRIQNTPVASAGEISLIVGKKKSRKSLFIVWLLTEFLKKHVEAIVFDTEQGRRHIWKSRDRVFRATKKLIPFLSMRDKSPTERMEIIEQTLSLWTPALKLIVIDGIRDLMSDINNPDESTKVMTWLQKISTKYNVHIITVLHLNKTDKNPRGHIGTELVNKAESTIELELDDNSNSTIVKCESSREKGFESFAFTHGYDDLPQMVDMPDGDKEIALTAQKSRLIECMAEGPMNRKDLIMSIRDNFAWGERKAATKLSEFKRLGWVITSGEQRSKNLVYKINTSNDTHEAPPPNFRPLHKVEPKPEIEPELNFSENLGIEMPPTYFPPPPPDSLFDLPF